MPAPLVKGLQTTILAPPTWGQVGTPQNSCLKLPLDDSPPLKKFGFKNNSARRFASKSNFLEARRTKKRGHPQAR